MPGPTPPFMDPNFVIVELIFSVIIIALALLIYLRTREMYALTKHKGIGYFRNAFLFFALAYIFRYLFHFFQMSRLFFNTVASRQLIAPAPLILTGYLSTMAIFFLILSTLWRKTKDKPLLYIAQVFAIIITALVAVFRTPEILTIAQLVLLVFAIVMSHFSYQKSKKHSQLFIIYIILFIIWVFNISVLGPIRFLPFGLRILSPVISIILFAIIYFRVTKWTK